MKKNERLKREQARYCAASEGGVRVDDMGWGQDSHSPQKIEEAFKKARYWFKSNLFVRPLVKAQLAFFNFGFEVKAVEAKEKEGVKEWWRRQRRQLRAYARDAWTDWLLLDNIVGVWRKEGGRPLVYPPEETLFTDAFGLEKLTVLHKLTAEQLRKLTGLSRKEVEALTKGSNKLELTHGDTDLFEFDVCKRERVGQGYAWPGLAVIFSRCAGQEGLEVEDALRGNLGRNVYEQHKVGHEIKSGAHAGSKVHFCNKGRVQEVEAQLKGKVGHIKLVTNFDHAIEFPGQDPKRFEAKRYDGFYRALEVWGMPLAQMIFGKTLNPYLMEILKVQAIAERENLEDHFNKVFNGAQPGPPADVRVSWSNRCFRDSRLAADLLKKALETGPLSQGTFLEEAGYSPEEERERKAAEAKLPKEQVLPLFDPAHGKRPGETPGRKSGMADGQGE